MATCRQSKLHVGVGVCVQNGSTNKSRQICLPSIMMETTAPLSSMLARHSRSFFGWKNMCVMALASMGVIMVPVAEHGTLKNIDRDFC